MNKNYDMKPYFKKIKVGEEIFGLVFGPGKVRAVWGDGHFTFEVEFDNGFTVPYTPEGFPGWGGKLDFQTIFYKGDIDLMDLDFSPKDCEILSPKKIIKLRNKKQLEVRCPSGLWQPVEKCPGYVTEEYLEEGKLHLFRKSIKRD